MPRGGGEPEDDTAIDTSTDEYEPPIQQLPQTGDSSPVPYYALGSFLALTGLMNMGSRKRTAHKR